MTTKTEPGSPAPEPPAHADLSANGASTELRRADASDDDDRQPVHSLPSIIVDPSAYSSRPPPPDDGRSAEALQTNDAATSAEAEPHAAAAAANGSGEAHADASESAAGAPAGESDAAGAPAELNGDSAGGSDGDDDGDGDDRLSIEEAERFAERFRPSWHSVPEAPVAASTASAPATPEPLPEVDSVLPRRNRGLAMVGLAVGSFVLLAGLALMSARSSHPEPKAEAPASKSAEAPAAAAKPPPAAIPQPAVPLPPMAAVAAPAGGAEAPTAVAPAAGAESMVALNDPPADPAAAAAATTGTAVPTEQTTPAGDPSASGPAETAPPPAAAQAAPAAATPEPAAAATVHIQLRTLPENATLRIDEVVVANPYDQMLPKSGKHRIRADAPGYRESDFTLSFDRHRDLSLRLQKLRPARTARRTARQTRPAPAPVPPVSAPAPRATPVPALPPPKPSQGKGAGFVSESPY